MKELKKCPFCGGEASVKMKYRHNVRWTIWCECNECHAESSGCCPRLDKEDTSLDDIDSCRKYAIEAWNRRVEE